MFCSRCGVQNADTAKFCHSCGNVLNCFQDYEKNDTRNNKKNSTKKIYYIIGVIVIGIALIGAVLLGIRGKKAKEYETYLTSAEKYIEELHYEQAKDFYLKAIEISPKQLEPYVKLAQVYIVEGDVEKAEQILELAEEQGAVGDEEMENVFQELLSELHADNCVQEQFSNAEYLPVVKEVWDEMKKEGWPNGYGALYDVDKNGIDELLLLYTMDIEMENGDFFPACVCSVYTLDNGKPLALIEKEMLYVEVGGPWGYVAVIEKDEEIELAIMSETGETGIAEEGISRWGSWKLFQIDGTSIKVNKQIEYEYVERYDENDTYIVYDESKAVINNKECSFQEYEEWESSKKNILVVEPIQNNDNMDMEKLISYLQENKV